MIKGPLNSTIPPNSDIVGGVFNSSAPSPADGQPCALQLDAQGNLKTTVAGSGVTSNINIVNITGNPPASTNPLFVELSDGTNALGTDGNPIRTSPSTIAAIGVVSTKTALTASTPIAVSVGTSTGAVVGTNASRKGLILVNTSVNTISLGLGVSAVLNSGITLQPGGTFEMDEYSFFTGAVNAIASVAASNLAVQEYTT